MRCGDRWNSVQRLRLWPGYGYYGGPGYGYYGGYAPAYYGGYAPATYGYAPAYYGGYGRVTMLPPIMVGTGALFAPHTHTTALGTIAGIVIVGDRQARR